jgi:hypothetical protein
LAEDRQRDQRQRYRQAVQKSSMEPHVSPL